MSGAVPFDYKRPLGWILTTVSLLGLIQDAGLVVLKGKLLVWMNSYLHLTKTVGNFLFGWIHWRWMSVTTLEVHLVIVSIVFSSIWLRASIVEREGKPDSDAFAAMAYPLLVLLILVLIPEVYGFLIAALTLAGLISSLYGMDAINNNDLSPPALQFVLTETGGVICIFLIVIFLNSYLM